jgi:N-acetylglucosamine-6-phosphate deacetylase
MGEDAPSGVRIVTAAPEVNGVLDAVHDLDQRGIVFSIGHRYVGPPFVRGLFTS